MQKQIAAQPIWISAKDLTQTTGLSRMTIFRLFKSGKIEARKLGRSKTSKRLYRLASVLSYIENSGEGGEQ